MQASAHFTRKHTTAVSCSLAITGTPQCRKQGTGAYERRQTAQTAAVKQELLTSVMLMQICPVTCFTSPITPPRISCFTLRMWQECDRAPLLYGAFLQYEVLAAAVLRLTNNNDIGVAYTLLAGWEEAAP